MLYEIDNETVDFLCEHKLTLNQLAICLLIYKKDKTNIMKMNHELGVKIGDCLIPNGLDSQGKKKYKKEIIDLIDRDFIRFTFDDKEDKYNVDNFEVSNRFLKDLGITTNLFEEFWQEYPKSLFVQGIEYPAKSADYEELEKKYLKLIKNSKTKHKEIIEILRHFKSNNTYAQMGIEKFIGSRQWESLEIEVTQRSKIV